MQNVQNQLLKVIEDNTTLVGVIPGANITITEENKTARLARLLKFNIQQLSNTVTHTWLHRVTDWDWDITVRDRINGLDMQSAIDVIGDLQRRADEAKSIAFSFDEIAHIDWLNVSFEDLNALHKHLITEIMF